MRALAAVSCLVVSVGCNPTFSPPLRSTHGGALAYLTPRQGAVTLAASAHPSGTLEVSIPVRDGLRVEASGDATRYSGVGTLGVRATHLAGRAAMEGELGLGAGVGGAVCGNQGTAACNQAAPGGEPVGTRWDGLSPWERFAFGGYAGVGVGVRPWRVLGFHARARLQVTRADGAPTTLWSSAVAGVHVTLGPVGLFLNAGWAAYFNARDQEQGAQFEAGLTAPFAVR